MFFQRKNFEGAWKLFRLNKDEFSAASKSTVKTGLRALSEIKSIATENKMELTPLQELGLLVYYALKIDSLASDLIESQEQAKRLAAEKAKTE